MTAVLGERLAEAAGRPRLVRPGDVVDLQSVREYPCVSVLMTTLPGPTMAREDADRLARLLGVARRRLAVEPDSVAADRVHARLELLARDAAQAPTATALALFASPSTTRLIHLPVSVADRVVVDPTFATRDLVRSLQRRPPHLVLVLGRQARILTDDGHGLVEQRTAGMPVRIRGSLRERLRQVDAALGTVLGRRQLPVVVVGDRSHVTAFLRHSRHQGSLVGAVGGTVSHVADASPADLAEQVRPILDDFLGDRERAATDLLAQRARRGRAVSGLTRCWSAVVTGEPEMLVVEESLALPARVSHDGVDLIPSGDAEAPDVLDDAVDELIELVLARGGWVALVADGTLADHGGVAVTMRRAGSAQPPPGDAPSGPPLPDAPGGGTASGGVAT